jgi:hypothetical protein
MVYFRGDFELNYDPSKLASYKAILEDLYQSGVLVWLGERSCLYAP